MLWRLAAAGLLLWAIVVPAGASGPAGPQAEWNFDAGQGDVARDASGNGHDAKLFGATRVSQGDGFALSLDGFDDYVIAGESATLGFGGPVSVETWIKPMR